MKKLVLAMAVIAAFATTANAVPSSPARQEVINLRFITSAAANANGGVVDSVVARRVGAAGASSVLDTTKAISTEGWVIPTTNHTGAATDTSQVWMTLLIYGAAQIGDACESGADSLGVALQVSPDGVTWLTTAAIAGQTVSAGTNPIATRNNQTIANGAFRDALSLNGAALANGQPVWMFKHRFRGINQRDAVDSDNAFQYPFIRFILSFHDAKAYKVQGKVIVLSAANE